MATFLPNAGAVRRPIQGQAVAVTGPGVSNAPSDAIGRMGQAVEGAALDAIQTERVRLDQQQRERQQLYEAAEKQRELIAIDKNTDALRDAHDEIGNQLRAGQIQPDQAERAFSERANAVLGEAVPTFRPQSQDLARAHIERVGLTLGNSVRKLADDQTRHNITAGMQTQLETLQREYRVDPAGATALAMELIQTQGPQSSLAPEQRAKLAQSWKEQTQFTAAFDAISAGRDDRKALGEAEKFITTLPDLDPQKRAQLVDRAQTYRMRLDQQDELRAQRAQRAADAALKRAEAEFTTFQTLADKGGVLDPAYVDRVTRATAGTPYQAGVLALAKQAVETGGFAAQPLNVQRATLQALDSKIATEGRNPALDKHREKLARVLGAAENDIKADPLNAALERGVVTQLAPINLAAGVSGLAQQLQARSQQAATVETWTGGAVSPLTKAEAEGVAGLLKSMPPDQKATALGVLTSTMTPRQAQALAGQLDPQDKALGLALAAGAAQTTFDRPVSELILRGAEAIKTKAVKLDDANETGLTAQIDKELGGAITNPEQAQRVREAAKLIWLGKAAEGQRIDPGNAVRLAIGGKVVDHNGGKVVIPAGMEAGDLSQRLASYPADALASQLTDGKVYVRGQPVEAAQFLAALPGAQLRTLARGKFAVVSGGAVVTNANMKPVIVEVGNAR